MHVIATFLVYKQTHTFKSISNMYIKTILVSCLAAGEVGKVLEFNSFLP